MTKYFWNFLIALDQFLNALTGGDPDETISSRLGKARRGDYGAVYKFATAPLRWFVDLAARVIFGQSDHCAKSIEEDEGRSQVL